MWLNLGTYHQDVFYILLIGVFKIIFLRNMNTNIRMYFYNVKINDSLTKNRDTCKIKIILEYLVIRIHSNCGMQLLSSSE